MTAQTSPPRIAADPRIELLAIVFRLAGALEFSQNRYVEYDADVRRQFGTFRAHEAVVLARRLHQSREVTYSWVMRLAIGLGPPPALEPRLPYDSILPGRVPGAEMQRFVEALRRFVRDTHAPTFFAAQRARYDSAGQRLRSIVDQSVFTWVMEFFGGTDRDFVVAPLLAASDGAYGPCVRPSRGRGAGRLECWQILGHHDTDAAGFVAYDRGVRGGLVHELSHAYANPLVHEHSAELERSASRVYAAFGAPMAAQASSWSTMVSESLVRSAVARFLVAHGTPGEQEGYRVGEHAGGWYWLDELKVLFATYQAHRRTYPTLATFMPRIVAWYNTLPARTPALQRRYDVTRPHVVSVSFGAADAAAVDPQLREIVVRFDRPVREGDCGPWCRGVVPLFVNGEPTATELPPAPVTAHMLDSTGTTLRITVALEPGHEYSFQLNTLKGDGFGTGDGVPLEAYPIRFRTRHE